MEEETVKCLLCGKEFKNCISHQHVFKEHGITLKEYREKFPGSNINTESYRKILSNNMRHKKQIEIKDLEKAPILDKTKIPEIKDIDLFKKVDELRDFTVKSKKYFDNKHSSMPDDKLQILNFLVSIFSEEIIDSYFVTKFTMTGSVEYMLVTDIAIPSLKIDIEFPNTFWHNYDRPKEIRDSILINDKWKIININNRIPKISDVEKAVLDIITKK